MNKLYSKPNLGFLKNTSNSILRPGQVWSHKALYSRPTYLYRSQKKKAEAQEDEQFIISDEELVDSQLVRKTTFRERNKVTFGLFGSGVVSSFLGFPLVSTGLYTASFISLWRAERLWLRIWKLYEDIYGTNTQKYMNLNSLLIDLMQKNDEIGKFIKRDTITFSNMFLSRKSHAENRLFNHDSYESVQRRYNYTLDFFDVGTGAEGRISSQCVYNYDKDYYFRLVYVYMFSPKQTIVKIEDSRDTVDIPSEPK